MSQFNLIEQVERLLKLIDKQTNEIDDLRKDNEYLTKENRMLKEALGYEQRQNQRQSHGRSKDIL